MVFPNVLKSSRYQHCSVSGDGKGLPSKSEVIRQFSGMHLLLDAFANSIPVSGSIEMLILRVKVQYGFTSISKFEQRDFLRFHLGDMVVFVSIAEQSESSSLCIDTFSITVRLEVTEKGGTMPLSGSKSGPGGWHLEAWFNEKKQ